ncbi:recombinase family protein [Sorangium sp. So ce388]|uniref:recombinase family protein n=1 Tax=Sorangium sp. So ce388 TaxID=3133309 RepID=UPI003F5AE836
MQQLTSWTKSAPPPERFWAFYVRVTREESVTADLSIPNQIARAKEIAAARGWTDWRIYVEPKHVSGELWVEKRPALRELLADVAAGRVVGACARHTDRLWRTSEIQDRILRAFRERNVELWDFSGRHEYKSAHGRFSLRVLGAAAELEIGLTAERIREMKRGKARAGKVGGGPPPFGYTSQSRRMRDLVRSGMSEDAAYQQACTEIPVGKRWVVDESEAEVVRLIFELYTAPQHRLGCKRITRVLHQRGHKTREGCDWLSNAVRKLINNPAYAGLTSFDEQAYEEKAPSRLPRHQQALFAGEHPAIVSPEVWRLAQTIKISENTVRRTKDGPKASEFSLTGLLRCPRCSSRMIGKGSAHSTRRYYICSRRHNGGPDLCPFPLVNAVALQREVWGWLHGILTSPELVRAQVERLARRLEKQRPKAAHRLAEAEAQREEITGKLRRYYEAFEAGDLDRATLRGRVDELNGRLLAVETELAALKAKAAPAPKRVTTRQVESYLAVLRQQLDEHPERQRVLLQGFHRSHDLRIQAKSSEEFTVSIALAVDPHTFGVGLREQAAERPCSLAGCPRSCRRCPMTRRWTSPRSTRSRACSRLTGGLSRLAPSARRTTR